MLTLDAVSKRFALKAGYFAAARRHVYACARGEPAHRGGRDLRAGGRVGQRARPPPHAWRWACTGPTAAPSPIATAPATCTRSTAQGPARDASCAPGWRTCSRIPARSPQPAHAGGVDSARRPALHRELARPGRRARPGPGGPGGGGAGRAPPEPPPARLLRRPAPAGGHRPRPDRPARDHHLRRDRLRPRRGRSAARSWSCCSACAASWA